MVLNKAFNDHSVLPVYHSVKFYLQNACDPLS